MEIRIEKINLNLASFEILATLKMSIQRCNMYAWEEMRQSIKISV